MKRIFGVIAGVIALAFVATGCSSVSTDTDQVALHYEGGQFSSRTFSSCVPVSKKSWFGPGDHYYVYPTSQRVYDATGREGAESQPFKVVSKDNAELTIPVSVNFTLKTACDGKKSILVKFHNAFGNRYHAYWDSGDSSDEVPAGWITLLNKVMGQPLDTTLDRIAQEYNWRDLWNNPQVKLEIEKQINENLATLVKRQTGGVQYFEGFSALVQKPEPTNPDLTAAISSEQAGVAQANSAKAQADADTAKAQAQVAVAKAEAAKKQAEIDGFGGIENYLKFQCIQAGCNPYQPSYGSAVVNPK